LALGRQRVPVAIGADRNGRFRGGLALVVLAGGLLGFGRLLGVRLFGRGLFGERRLGNGGAQQGGGDGRQSRARRHGEGERIEANHRSRFYISEAWRTSDFARHRLEWIVLAESVPGSLSNRLCFWKIWRRHGPPACPLYHP